MYATSVPRDSALSPIFAVAKPEAPQRRGKGLESWRATGSHRLHTLSLTCSLLNYHDFLLLLLSLQCFIIVRCYDTSGLRRSVFTVQLRQIHFRPPSFLFRFFFLQQDFTTATALRNLRYSANRETTS